MHLGVLAASDSWYFKDLVRAAGGSHEIVSLSFRDLVSTAGSGGVGLTARGLDLSQFEALLVRTMPVGSLEQVVFRMDVLGQAEAAGQVVLNPPRAMEVAVDKYLATVRLQRAGLKVPATITCQTPADALAAFHTLGGDVVVKPLFGSEGRGITRLNDEALAQRAFSLLAPLGAVLYVQRYIDHAGFDFRLLVLGDQVFGIRRRNPLDWRTNVSRGAVAEPLEVTPELATMARRAAAAIGAPLAGVDLLADRQGELYAIEVNAIPGWKALGQTLQIDVAQRVLEYVERCIVGRSAGRY